MISGFYLLVDRDFIVNTLLNDRESIYEFNSEDRRIAMIETDCKGFHTYNKHISVWKISFFVNRQVAFINPVLEVNSRL